MQETQETGVRGPGGGNGNPYQYSGLERSMDRQTRRAAVHGIAKSRTRLSTASCIDRYAISVIDSFRNQRAPGTRPALAQALGMLRGTSVCLFWCILQFRNGLSIQRREPEAQRCQLTSRPRIPAWEWKTGVVETRQNTKVKAAHWASKSEHNVRRTHVTKEAPKLGAKFSHRWGGRAVSKQEARSHTNHYLPQRLTSH